MSKPNVINFFSGLHTAKPKVDLDAGMIRGVSLITGGITAKGHELDVDDETLGQILSLATKMGKVPVKADHGSGVMHVCGYLTNFRREGNKVVGDWKLLRKHTGFAQIMETAEEQPETVGLSVSFVSPDEPVVGLDGRQKARALELLSTDYVIHPAANPTGLFQDKRVDTPKPSNMANENEQPSLTDVLNAIQGLTQTVESIQGQVAEQQQFIEAARSQQDLSEAAAIIGLTPEEAAEHGLSEDDILEAQQLITEVYGDGAVEQIMAEAQGDGQGYQPEGQEHPGQSHSSQSGEGQGEAAATTASAFASFERKITNLSRKLERIELAEEEDEIATEFEEINNKIVELKAKEKQLTELQAENEQLRTALNGAAGKAVLVQFSDAGTRKNDDATAFESRVSARITELKAKNSDLTEAQAKAQAWRELKAEDPDGFTEFQARTNGRTTTL